MKQNRFLDMGQEKYGDRGAWIFSSRGCPYKCTYCASCSIWTRKWRARSPNNIVKEINSLIKEFNVNRINFADDTFSISKKRIIEFCEILINENLDVTWGCNVRVDNIDKNLFKIMKEAGCTDIWVGVESGSPIILEDIKKKITLNQIRNAFFWSKEVGLKRRAYLMIGSPKESKETINETERLLEEIKPDTMDFSILTPYPGCENYYDALKKGYINEKIDWSTIDLFNSECGLLPTEYLNREEIAREHHRLSEKYKEYKKV